MLSRDAAVLSCLRSFSALLLIFAVLSAAPSVAYSQDRQPSSEPILRLDTGMHMASIWRAAADAAGQILATASDDKTVRLWSVATGKLLHTLRPPIGEGGLWAVAMSPDGNTVAAGGNTSADGHHENVYLFDTQTGRLTRRIGELPYRINHLAWSADGRFIAVALQNKGVRVFRAADGEQAGADTDYEGDSYGIEFDGSGRLAAVGFDGFVRLYDEHFKLITKAKAPGGNSPYSVAFSPDATKLAVGYDSNLRVDVLSATDLDPLFTADMNGLTNGSFSIVAWRADGALLAGGSYGNAGGFPVVLWQNGGRGTGQALSAANSTVRSIVPLSDGGFVYATADPAFGRYDAQGQRIIDKQPDIVDYRGEELLLSPHAVAVALPFKSSGRQPISFSVADRQLVLRAPQPDFAAADWNGLKVTDWRDSDSPKLNGKRLKLNPLEKAQSVAVAPNRQSLLLGTYWFLRRFDAAGIQVWQKPTPDVTWAVNLSRDGRLAVAAFGDGTIRWYRYSDGEELLSLFIHKDGQHWVLWTPEGYYDAAAGAEDLIGWQVNRGANHEADFFSVTQFRDRFNRPDIVALMLETLDQDEAVRRANEVSGRKAAPKVADSLPPVVKILSPSDSSVVSKSPIELTYLVRSQSPITDVSVQIDGRPVATAQPTPIMTSQDGSLASLSVEVPQQNAVISLIATNNKAPSEPAIVHVGWQGSKDWYKPDLYVLAVGVATYKDGNLNLLYPNKDAEDFVQLMKPQEGGLYGHVYVKDLPNEEATREEIRKGLSWLRKSTTSRDVAVLFLSGHGQNDAAGHYHYLPYNADLSDLDLTTIQDFEIEDFLSKVPGKVVVFLDTCFAGALHAKGPTQPNVDKLANTLASAEKGIVVFTSSTGRQFSLEKPEWKNGAFTKALLEAFKGGADYQHDKTISIAALEVYLGRRVRDLTNGEQSPTSAKPKTIPDFVIATVVQ